MELQELAQVRDNESFIQEFDQISDDSDVSYGGKFMQSNMLHKFKKYKKKKAQLKKIPSLRPVSSKQKI